MVTEWKSSFPGLIDEFSSNKYLELPSIIHPLHVAALRDYFLRLIGAGQLTLGDGQSDRRYFAHNDPVASYYHDEFARVVSALAGRSVKPSYSYFIAYENEASLAKHVDREQCDYTLNCSIDYRPDPTHREPWPLQLFVGARNVEIVQAPGDGLLYRGCQIGHARSSQPPGSRSMSLLFHYVANTFAGSLD